MGAQRSSAFGQLLRQYRQAAGLSQERLAERAGLSLRGISDLERGVRMVPRLHTVQRLADGLALEGEDRAALLAARNDLPDDEGEEGVPPRLPMPVTPLIGREQEVAAVVELFAREEVRLVTLVGPGGVGKTRLALGVAHWMAGPGDRDALFVDLAPVRDPALVLPTIAAVLGMQDTGARPLAEVLAVALGSRHLLLVLDNLEQVVDAAPQIAALLAACPSLLILATSRVRLRIAAEHVFPVLPLRLPKAGGTSLEEMARTEAVALFMVRARAADRGFSLTEANRETVAEICRCLEGLPLAIELAAARVAHLPLPTLLERRLPLLTGGGREAPARQRTMRDAIAWSCELLAPDEQRLLRRLAVFVGGFTLEAAEAMAGAVDPSGTDVLEGLASLVETSLVRWDSEVEGEPRYRMLETVREFALEQLAASGEEEQVREAHAACFVALGEAAEPHLHGPEQDRWIDRLTRDLDNIRSALAWAELSPASGPVLGLRLAGAITLFWMKRAHIREGVGYLERLLAQGATVPDHVRAKALFGAGQLAGWLQELHTAIARFQESLALYRLLGDRRGEGRALSGIAVALLEQQKVEQAIPLLNASLVLSKEAGDAPYVAITTSSLGMATFLSGDHPGGLGLVEQGLAGEQACGEQWGVNLLRPMLASLYFAHGDQRRALQLCLDQLRESVDEDLLSKDAAFIGLACIACQQERYEQAARFASMADILADRTGARLQYGFFGLFPGVKERVRAALGDSAYADATASGAGMTPRQILEEATTMLKAFPDEDEADGAMLPGADVSTWRVRRGGQALSGRELEVVRLVAQGYSDREIAETLFVSRRTVTTHVTSILDKLGVSSRSAAAVYALRHELI